MAETQGSGAAGSLTGDRLARSVGQKIRYAKVRLHAQIDRQAAVAQAELRAMAERLRHAPYLITTKAPPA
jgi:hypothetical protein